MSLILTGNSSLNEQAPHLYRVDYVTDHYLPLLQKADLVVTRGGANTIFELLAMNKTAYHRSSRERS